MATKKKMLEAAAGGAGGAGLDITDVFSTYLYTGTGANRDFTNGIDLAGDGGLVWIKSRTVARGHQLYDSERTGAAYQVLSTDTTSAQYDVTRLTSLNSDGFSTNNSTAVNGSSEDYASWTFRKAPKFFDVVTYTGNGVAGRTVAHNLGSVPGMVIVKQTSASGKSWLVYHRGLNGGVNPEQYYVTLNTTAPEASAATIWNNTAPTDSVFTLGSVEATNGSGFSFVAYLFAHNNSDGEFGPDSDQDIIKCGSFTDNGSSTTVDLGFEPQLLLVKRTNTSGGWALIDDMRGLSDVYGTRGVLLQPNGSTAEIYSYQPALSSATGFVWKTGQTSVSGDSLIYMAIRARDGNVVKEPDAATDCFSVNVSAGAAGTALTAGFPTDMQIQSKRSAPVSNVLSRNMNLMSVTIASAINSGLKQKYLQTASTAQAAYSEEGQLGQLYNNTGFSIGSVNGGASTAYYSFKRARGFFDVVAYTGNSTAGHNVSHNLVVAPEMMWVKERAQANSWQVYHSSLPNTSYMSLNTDGAEATSGTTRWNSTDPTDSVFTLGTDTRVNANQSLYISYLFTTLDGISKVGGYTGNGSSQTIDCGFTSGARFVLIKNRSQGYWIVYDSVRGIVAGNDPALFLNTTDAEDSGHDQINPDSSGFIVVFDSFESTLRLTNQSGANYIFYAIA